MNHSFCLSKTLNGFPSLKISPIINNFNSHFSNTKNIPFQKFDFTVNNPTYNIDRDSSSNFIETAIPKIIHYVWVGNKKLPPEVKRMIDTWRTYCPDYEIIEWNETNFDIQSARYTREAYRKKKWAFVSDYIRLKVLYQYGGIYLDTDMELLKPLDDFLSYSFFAGFESKDYISAGIIGSAPQHYLTKRLFDVYQDLSYDAETHFSTIVTKNTNQINKFYNCEFKDNGTIQYPEPDIAFFPQDYFYPGSMKLRNFIPTENSYTIHHYAASWRNSPIQKLRSFLKYKVIGAERYYRFKQIFKKNKKN